MDLFEKSLTDVFVANTSTGAVTTVAAMANSSVAVQNADGSIRVVGDGAVTNGLDYRIVLKSSNGTVTYSPWFKPEQILTKKTQAYSAPVEQVSYVGYNGTSGNLDANANTEYVLRVILDYTQRNANNTPVIKSLAAYTNAASAQELATSLFDVAALEFNPQRLAGGHIIIDRVANGTYTNTVGWTTVVGSNVITKAGHGLTTELATGNAIRLNTGATASTSAVYFVVSYTVNTVTLDRAVTSSAFTNLAWPSAAPTSFGIKLTGQDLLPWNPQTDVNNKVFFTLNFNKADGGTSIAPITYTTGMSYGNGSYKEVAVKEGYGYMQKRGGAPYFWGYSSPAILREATYGNTYTYSDLFIQKTLNPFEGTGQAPIVTNRILVAHKVGIDSIAAFVAAFTLT